jgi:hypothetical protein
MSRSRQVRSRTSGTGRSPVTLKIGARPGKTHNTTLNSENIGADDETVGYGRPPKAHQFQPGHSGNPSGHRKGARSEAAILQQILSRKITIREGDKARRISLLEAILLKSAEEALRGELKATAFLLSRLTAAARWSLVADISAPIPS